MAMKPAGKAIIILAILGVVGVSVWKTGLLDKAAPVAAQPSLMPEPAAQVTPAPVVASPAAPAPVAPAATAAVPAVAPAKDAMDALIHEQKK